MGRNRYLTTAPPGMQDGWRPAFQRRRSKFFNRRPMASEKGQYQAEKQSENRQRVPNWGRGAAVGSQVAATAAMSVRCKSNSALRKLRATSAQRCIAAQERASAQFAGRPQLAFFSPT